MRERKLSLWWGYLAVAMMVGAPSTRADIFCQPPSGPIQNEWRAAGSTFLDGIGQTITALARIEGDDIASARSEMERAKDPLNKARDLYEHVQSLIARPRVVNREKVPPERLKSMDLLFRSYKMGLPSDERQAAGLAQEAVEGLAASLEANKDLFARYKLENLQGLLGEVTRTLQLGRALAELMKYGLTEG